MQYFFAVLVLLFLSHAVYAEDVPPLKGVVQGDRIYWMDQGEDRILLRSVDLQDAGLLKSHEFRVPHAKSPPQAWGILNDELWGWAITRGVVPSQDLEAIFRGPLENAGEAASGDVSCWISGNLAGPTSGVGFPDNHYTCLILLSREHVKVCVNAEEIGIAVWDYFPENRVPFLSRVDQETLEFVSPENAPLVKGEWKFDRIFLGGRRVKPFHAFQQNGHCVFITKNGVYPEHRRDPALARLPGLYIAQSGTIYLVLDDQRSGNVYAFGHMACYCLKEPTKAMPFEIGIVGEAVEEQAQALQRGVQFIDSLEDKP